MGRRTEGCIEGRQKGEMGVQHNYGGNTVSIIGEKNRRFNRNQFMQ